ncbi:MAG: hypothetical protein ACLPQY_10585 [Streptosporangiaceae bacterium]
MPEPGDAGADSPGSPVLPEPGDAGADSPDSPVLPEAADPGPDGPAPAGPNEITIELPVVPLAAETVAAETAVGSPVPPEPADADVSSPVLPESANADAGTPALPEPGDADVDSPVPMGAGDADVDSSVPPRPADAAGDSPVPSGLAEATVELPVVALPADMTVALPVVPLPAEPVPPLPAERIIDHRVPPLPAKTVVGHTVPPTVADAGPDQAAPLADAGPDRDRPVPPRAAGTANSRGLTALAVAAGLVVAAVGLAQTSPGHSLLREVGLYAEPATYTALAFTNPQSLPSHLPAAPAQVAMSFGVGNASPGPQRYSWSIVLEAAGQTSRLAAGDVGVPAHGHATVTRTVTASCPGGKAVIAVRLAAPAESIDFQAACSP